MAMKISSGPSGWAGTLSAGQRAGEQANAGPVTNSERRQSREDKLELSEDALAVLQGGEPVKADDETGKTAEDVRVKDPLSSAEQRAQDKISALNSMRQMLDSIRQQSAHMAEQSEKQAKAMKESLDKMKRCSKIAKNIQKGHKVPPKDEKYLLENDPKLYMMAMALRMLEEQDNKKVKSELKDEEEQQQNETASGVESAGAEGAADIAVETGSDISVE